MGDPRMDLTLKDMPEYKGPKGNLGKWETSRVAGKSSSSHIVESPVSVTAVTGSHGSRYSSPMG